MFMSWKINQLLVIFFAMGKWLTHRVFCFIVFRQLLHDEPMSRSPEIKMLVDLQMFSAGCRISAKRIKSPEKESC